MSISAISVRNQFRGEVADIIEGPVVPEIDAETSFGVIVMSVSTTCSALCERAAWGAEQGAGRSSPRPVA